MPTIIDSLIIELGLDPKNFDAGRKKIAADFLDTRKDAEEQAKHIEEAGKKSAQFFSQMKTAALEMFAAFTGARGLKDFIQSVVATDTQTAILAKTLDSSTEEISAWQGVLKMSGGTADDATASMQGLVSQFQEMATTGNSTMVPFLRSLGVQFSDHTTGKMKNMTQFFLELADAFHNMDPARAAAFGRGMGLTPLMTATLMKGSGELKKLLEQQKQLGLVTPADARAALQLTASWNAASQAATTLGRNIATILTPALVGVLDKITKLLTLNYPKLWFSFFSDLESFLHGGNGVRVTNDGLHINFGELFGSGKGGKSTPLFKPEFTSSVQSLLNAIGSTEGGILGYGAQYGTKQPITDFSRHPNIERLITRGPNRGKLTSAAGKYQFEYGTWLEAQRALNLPDFGPKSQDRAAWWLAQRDYRRRTHRDLAADLASHDPRILAGIGPALSKTFTSLPGGIEQLQSPSHFLGQLAGLARSSSGGNTTSNIRNDVHIGKIEVITKATDARGIAKDIGPAIKRNSLVTQANNGPQ